MATARKTSTKTAASPAKTARATKVAASKSISANKGTSAGKSASSNTSAAKAPARAATTASRTTRGAAAAPAAKTAARAPARSAQPVAATMVKATITPMKPIKDAFNKTSLAAHLAEASGVEPRAVKAVLAALEATAMASLHKKGAGSFTLPGLLKITAENVPAKKKRFGVDPFTKAERWFPAKPASVRVKVRALKKLKDSAL